MALDVAYLTKVVLALTVLTSLLSVSFIQPSNPDGTDDNIDNGDDNGGRQNEFTEEGDIFGDDQFQKLFQDIFPIGELPDPDHEMPFNQWNQDYWTAGSVAHTFTDKPVYRPSDIIFIRSVYLSNDTLKPIGAGDQESTERFWGEPTVDFIVKNPDSNANICEGVAQISANSVAYAQCQIPEDTTGGLYTVQMSSWNFPMTEREIEIRHYVRPELNISVNLDSQTYVAGDNVDVVVTATKMNGDQIHGAEVEIQLFADGVRVTTYGGSIDSQNEAQISVTLPTRVLASASVNAKITSGGLIGSRSKSVPVALGTVKVKYYPEGGSSIFDINQKVYFESFITFNQPGEWTAQLMKTVSDHDSDVNSFLESRANDEYITDVTTFHEGRGSFQYTPQAGGDYYLKFTHPAGIASTGTALPQAETNGTILSAHLEDDNDVVKITTTSSTDMNLLVSIAHNGKKMQSFEQSVTAMTAQTFNAESMGEKFPAGGVITVTVYDKSGTNVLPIAERLLFVPPKKSIQMDILMDQEVYEPGSPVKGTIETYYVENDEKVSVRSRVGVTVTDLSSKVTVDERRLPPSLPISVMLEDQILGNLYDPTAYAYYEGIESARQAIDLLLGVQGWRRYIFWDSGSRLYQEFTENEDMTARIHRIINQGDMYMEDAMEMMMDEAEGGGDFNEAPQKRGEQDDLAAEDGASGEDLTSDDSDDAAIDNFYQLIVANGFVETYKHQLRSDYDADERIDFTETLFWTAGQSTDDNGKLEFEFFMNDSITTFEVSADCYNDDGFLGAQAATFTSNSSFYVDMKVPSSVTVGDLLNIPVTITNNEAKKMDVTLTVDNTLSSDHLTFLSESQLKFEIEAGAADGKNITFTVSDQGDDIWLSVTAQAIFGDGQQRSVIKKKLSSAFKGIPQEANWGGQVGPEKSVSQQFTFPDGYVPLSLSVVAQAYPTPFSNLTAALAKLIRDPYGCFEQTSSTTFPLVMALKYFQSKNDGSPEIASLISESKSKLQAGYKKLITFETPDLGFEWFGQSPGHEALTAYGLLQFHQMEEVLGIDANLIPRIQGWMEGRRDNSGGFNQKDQALDSFGYAPADITNAYIVWALATAGYRDLDVQINALLETAEDNDDSYFTSLVANSCFLLGRTSEGTALLQKVVGHQQEDGSVTGAATSITNSSGFNLVMETTALSVLGWLNDQTTFSGNAKSAMDYIMTAVQDGKYGSTQSTILALMAIIQYEAQSDKLGGTGEFVLTIDELEAGRIAFTKTAEQGIDFTDIATSHLLTTRDGYLVGSTINMSLSVENFYPEDSDVSPFEIPYSMTVGYKNTSPSNSDSNVLSMDLLINGDNVAQMDESSGVSFSEGDALPFSVSINHNGSDKCGMVVAVIGLPGNMEPVFDDLYRLKDSGVIDYYETLERQIILYWRGMESEDARNIQFNVKAITPGTYEAPASRLYLYYGDDEYWLPPFLASSEPFE